MAQQPYGWIAALVSAVREHGPTAAVTILIGALVAVFGAAVRKAFTSEAVLARVTQELDTERGRLAQELDTERARLARQRAEDRKLDAERLARIETDIAAIRKIMFEAFQRGRD